MTKWYSLRDFIAVDKSWAGSSFDNPDTLKIKVWSGLGQPISVASWDFIYAPLFEMSLD